MLRLYHVRSKDKGTPWGTPKAKAPAASEQMTPRYYLRATDPTNNEQIAFECVGLAVANAKAAELRMGRDRDVVMSLGKPSETVDPTN
jgi:hypothetical protein